jgi:hypothetical protein
MQNADFGKDFFKKSEILLNFLWEWNGETKDLIILPSDKWSLFAITH